MPMFQRREIGRRDMQGAGELHLRHPARLPQRTHHVGAPPVDRETDGDVVGARVGAELGGEGVVEPGPAGDPGDGGRIGHQRDRRERPLAHRHRVHELDGEVRRVRRRRAVAERDELAAPVEAPQLIVIGGENVGAARP